MSALPAGPNLGVPSFVYTMKKGFAPKQDYSVQDIQSAIHILISGNLENLSESTLEAILDLVYYPDHLTLLLNDRMTSSLFRILMQYPEGRSVRRCFSSSMPTILT